LATFSVNASEEFDDLADLNAAQKESVKEWETQFTGEFVILNMGTAIFLFWKK